MNPTIRIPPAAALVGANKLLFYCEPTLADVNFDNIGASPLYSGTGLSGGKPVPPGYFTNSPDGHLRMLYDGKGVNAITTQNRTNSVPADKNVGFFPYATATKKIHFECSLTMSTNDPDCFNAAYVMPQQHNTTQLDSNPAFPAKYEQWHEWDLYEAGHGVDNGGAYLGGYLQWAGTYNGAYTLAAAPKKGDTSIKFAASWPGETGPWTIQLSTGERHSIKLIEGNVGPYTIDPVKNDGNTTASIISYTRLITPHLVDTTLVDATVPHSYAGTYDPDAGLYIVSRDNEILAQFSTVNPNSPNAFRDSLSYYMIFQCASHGAGVSSWMDINYFSCWSS